MLRARAARASNGPLELTPSLSQAPPTNTTSSEWNRGVKIPLVSGGTGRELLGEVVNLLAVMRC